MEPLLSLMSTSLLWWKLRPTTPPSWLELGLSILLPKAMACNEMLLLLPKNQFKTTNRWRWNTDCEHASVGWRRVIVESLEW